MPLRDGLPTSYGELVRIVSEQDKALRPFAAMAAGLEGRPDAYVVASTAVGVITAGDLRRALAARRLVE